MPYSHSIGNLQFIPIRESIDSEVTERNAGFHGLCAVREERRIFLSVIFEAGGGIEAFL